MSKPLPTLTQMPWNVKQLIVTSADTVTKFSLRPCSKDFSNHVNNSTHHFDFLKLHVTSRHRARVLLHIDAESKHELVFRKDRDGVRVENSGISTLLETRDYEKTVVEQCVKLFRNPRVSLKKLVVYIDIERSYNEEEEEYHRYNTCLLQQLETSFAALNLQISVDGFSMTFEGSHEDVLRILPYLKPNTLKRIRIASFLYFLGFGVQMDMSQVAETEQWKRAKELVVLHRTSLSVENWSHFSSTVVVIHDLGLETIQQIYRAFVNSNQWNKANILNQGNCKESAIQHFSQLGPQEPGTHECGFRISIPRSDKYVVVKIFNFNIEFRKYE